MRAYGDEAAQALDIDPGRVFKTLVVTAGEALHVAIVPVSRQLDLKSLARVAGVKRFAMAPSDAAERATGYVVGGISPLAQRKRLPIWLDVSATEHETLFVSGGRRGLEIELQPDDLRRITGARMAAIAKR